MSGSTSRALLLASLVAATAGCGPSLLDSDDVGGGDGDGGIPETSCDELRNDTGYAAGLNVVIRNDRSTPIVLVQVAPCVGSYFTIDSMIDGFDASWPDGGCGLTCEDVLSGICGCDKPCAVPPPIRIEPGASYSTSWSEPGLFVPALLGPSCVEAGSSPCSGASECSVVRTPRAGAYQLGVVALSDPDRCTDPGCDCTPGSQGWCEASTPDAGEPDLQASATVDLLTEFSVVVPVR